MAYPATREPTALIRTSVLLEMGVRGGPHPHEPVPIGSLLGDILEPPGTYLSEFGDLIPFELPSFTRDAPSSKSSSSSTPWPKN